MQTAYDMVKEFQEKFQSRNNGMHMSAVHNDGLIKAGKCLLEFSKMCNLDSRKELRAHLMLEELGEMLIAMGEGDEVKALDGCCDLAYVVVGTAITFGWPLAEAFADVHRSNMSKERVLEGDVRLRDKGPNWSPPRIKEILDAHREK